MLANDTTHAHSTNAGRDAHHAKTLAGPRMLLKPDDQRYIQGFAAGDNEQRCVAVIIVRERIPVVTFIVVGLIRIGADRRRYAVFIDH